MHLLAITDEAYKAIGAVLVAFFTFLGIWMGVRTKRVAAHVDNTRDWMLSKLAECEQGRTADNAKWEKRRQEDLTKVAVLTDRLDRLEGKGGG